MHLIDITYVKPLAEVDAVVDAHRAHLERYRATGQVVVSGPKEPRTGGVILVENATDAEVDAMIGADPYTEAGVARFVVTAFNGRR